MSGVPVQRGGPVLGLGRAAVRSALLQLQHGRCGACGAEMVLVADHDHFPAGARLVGDCPAQPHEQRRAEFGAWRDALGEPDDEREYTTSSGAVRLWAIWDRSGSAGKGLRPLLSDRDGHQRAGVVLMAEILPDLDEDDAAGEVAR